MTLHQLTPRRQKPMYLQIAEILEEEIKRTCTAGAALPSELSLTQRFGVSRLTLRRAIDELVESGLLVRRHGIGIFVLDAAIDYRISENTRFTTMLEEAGHSTDTAVIRKQLVPASDEVADSLKIAPSEMVIWLETRRLVDDRPFCLVSHFIPHARFPQVFEAYDGGSLHGFFDRQCGVRLRRERSLISAPSPSVDDAKLLGMGRFHSVLLVRSVNVDKATGIAIEYAVTRFRGDRVQLEVPLI
jgi:GntR family transcriptional regulator, phosphonate transport system regulatory protein